jgi:hypothetical protein
LRPSRPRSHRRPLAAIAVVVGLVVPMSAAPAALAGDQPDHGWNVNCDYSHSLTDDPIVYPNQVGASHRHDFFANVTTDAHSTYGELRDGVTTCSSASDTAAYWSPSVKKDGVWVKPINTFAYYRVPKGTSPNQVKTVPKNLRMIAGNSKAPGPQATSIVYWGCSEDSGVKSDMPVNCSGHAGSTVLAHIIFPSCWDGKKLDSPDHKSHMAYPTLDEGCPNDHPVAIPTITMSIKWGFVNGKDITLASGAAYTLHGDFWNAWVQPDLDDLVHDCITNGGFCGIIH